MRATDMHVHVPRQPGLPEPALEAAMKAYFGMDSVPESAEALHKTNVYVDMSGWSPRYIPSDLIRGAKTRLQERRSLALTFHSCPPTDG